MSVAPETIVEAGIVPQDALERAKARSKVTGLTVEESVLELGLCPEVDLLRHYASKSNTRFVTTERLLSAKVSPEVLEKIPVRIAEEHTIVPVAYEPVSKTLSIVIGDATRAEVIGRIKQVAKVSEIIPLIGVTTAIRAALKKHYYGDATGLDLFRAQGLGGLFAEARALAASAGGRPSSFAAPPNEGSTVTAATRRANAAEVVASLERIALEALSRLSANKSRARWKLRRAGELGRRFDLPDAALEDLRLSSLLKSLCAPPKLELLRLPTDESGRAKARADIAAMMATANGFALTDNVALTLANSYEAWDGSGLPSGARGETIPLASRILAVLDAYSLLVHEKESGRQRPRSRAEAFVTLRSSENKLFDSSIVDALTVILDGEALRRQLKAQGRVVLLVLREKAARNIYREALEKADIPVHVSRSLEDAWQNVSVRSASLIVAGLSFGVDPLCRFVSYLRSRPATCSMPVLALGLAADNSVRDRLIKAGVNLVLDEERPAAEDAATIAGIFREQGELGAAGRPVDGETDELSLQEVARIIESNRRSGKLSVRTEAMNGQVDYEQGVPVYASWGEKRGASAKNLLLTLEQAEYVYEPDALLEELPNLPTSAA